MSSPVVSVVVATRNRPDLLRETAESVLRQDFPGRIELVVVFDQTRPDPDLAGELRLTGRAGPRSVLVVPNDRTPGLAGARNAGVAASSGSVLAFCDDDDTWVPEKVSTQWETLLAQDADLSVSGIRIRYGQEEHVRVPTTRSVTLEQLARRRSMEAHPSTVLVTRAAFERIGEVDEAIPGSYGEDYDWMLRAVAGGRVAVVAQPLVNVLWHPGSFFSTRWPVIVEALTYLLDKHPELRADRRGRARIQGQIAFAHAASGQYRQAVRQACGTLRRAPSERRAYLALLISTRIVSADRILRLANSRGRGV